MSDSPIVELIEGLATLLDSVSIGKYDTAGVYAADDVGIVFGAFTSEPSEQIVLTGYIVTDSPAPSNDTIVGVQVLLRGTEDLRSVQNRSGLIFDQFQGLGDRWFSSLYLATMWRHTGQLDGKDENSRWLSAESYYARTNWPTLYRTE